MNALAHNNVFPYRTIPSFIDHIIATVRTFTSHSFPVYDPSTLIVDHPSACDPMLVLLLITRSAVLVTGVCMSVSYMWVTLKL